MGLATAIVPTPAFQPFGGSWLGSILNQEFNAALTGAAFGGAYASATGGDIGQGMVAGATVWAVGAGVNQAIGHAVGFIASGFKAPTFANGAFYYDANTGGWITLGNVVTGPQSGINKSVDLNGVTQSYTYKQHELGHIPQGTLLGPGYVPLHAASLTVGAIVGVFTGSGVITGSQRSKGSNLSI